MTVQVTGPVDKGPFLWEQFTFVEKSFYPWIMVPRHHHQPGQTPERREQVWELTVFLPCRLRDTVFYITEKEDDIRVRLHDALDCFLLPLPAPAFKMDPMTGKIGFDPKVEV